MRNYVTPGYSTTRSSSKRRARDCCPKPCGSLKELKGEWDVDRARRAQEGAPAPSSELRRDAEDYPHSSDEPEIMQLDRRAKSSGRQAVPLNDPRSWVTSNDYPSRALREERIGVTTFRVAIDDDGSVADCKIISSSGHPDLDQATCANVSRRARFSRPSGDSEHSWTDRVIWKMRN